MKIISFFNHPYPDGYSPMIGRMHYYMKALLSEGADVEIVIPAKENKDGGINEGIPYTFVKVVHQGTRFNNQKVKKEYATIFSSLSKRCDVIFTSIDDSFTSLLTNSVHAAGGKIAIEMNENPFSIIGSRRDIRIVLQMQRLIFLNRTLPKVDGIITISHALNELITKHKREGASIVRIPVLTGNRELKKNRSYDGIPYILHAGALSEQKDGIKAMLRSFLIANTRLEGKLKLIFTYKIGLPSLLSWIDDFILKNGLENHIEFKGIVTKKDLDNLYNNCSLAIINKPLNSQNNYNFPTKLTELLPREIPIILSKTGELNYYFKDCENAFMVDANNVDQIAKKIIYILKNPNEAAQVARNARLLAEKEFYYLKHADELFSFFTSIMKNEKSYKKNT